MSVAGDGVLAAAAPLMAASVTSNALEVAAVSAAGFAAWLLVGLPAGVLVDRSRIRLVMIFADVGRSLVLALLVVLIVAGRVTVWWLLLAAFLLGVGSCFFEPAAQAMIPACAGRDPAKLREVNGRYWALDTLGRSLIGPPFGAMLFAWARQSPFLADGVSFAVSAVLVGRLPHRPRPAANHSLSFWSATYEGLVTVWRTRDLRVAALGMGTYSFGWSMANATLVLFATRTLHLTERQFGLALAGAAVGGLLGGWAHRVIDHADIRRVYALVLAVQGAAWWLTSLVPHPAALVTALAVVGFANTAISTAGAATRQHHAPGGSLGRVMATTRVFGVGSAAVGSVVGGMFASRLGLASPFGAAAFTLLTAGACFGAPSYVRALRLWWAKRRA